MAFIKWQEEFRTGIPKVDEQHRRLLDTLNDVHLLLRTEVDRGKLKDILFFLDDYILEHFSTEETLMQEARDRLPEELYQKHLAEHRFFVDKIQEFTGFLETEPPGEKVSEYAMDLFSFLGDWFVHHILEVDKETARYLTGRG